LEIFHTIDNGDTSAGAEKKEKKNEDNEIKEENEKNKKKKNRVNTIKLFSVFFKVGTFTIGGGYAMIPLIQVEFIQNKKWLDNREFVEILGITQSLPGPLITNFALLAGYRLNGIKGGLFSLLGAILPSFLIILIIVIHLWQFAEHRAVQAAFQGIRPVVVALIISAAMKLGKEILRKRYTFFLFLFFLGTLLLFRVHPLLVIIIGALAGFFRPYLFKNI